MKIREITENDANNLINLIKEVEKHSEYMLMKKGERQTTPDQMHKQIAKLRSQPNSTILAAEQNGKLIGYIFAIGGTVTRKLHSAYLVVGVQKGFRGMGAGTLLFKELDNWAASHGVSRLELTVVTENKSALALYHNFGFEIEGTKRNSLNMNGTYHDEYYMAKLY
ncbi:GNAT family N-acetyltransferase [Falsibacillus albus]|uniref:GNAT family N-acetyltransferase n=1 Tax=Falsibacillus albus TaxID=2478915 RepID=A0A3L7JTN5_9BACI|nr:GNAT family N-acetyltransferase [Falsibacillus albus]RLQ94203.1 GNAT family N-acetyltransferase [Falsibacillus albus]